MKKSTLWTAVAVLAAAAVAGCASAPPAGEGVSPSPSRLWEEPKVGKAVVKVEGRAAEIPPEIANAKWGLKEVLDVALRNNPATRSAWHDALAASARLGIARSASYPKVSLTASANYKDTYDSSKGFSSRQGSFGPAAGLSWLLLDFGSKEASEEAALFALRSANLTQNKAIEDVVLQTAKAYYLYLSSKALREARQKALERAEAHLKAAEERHDVGVATIADVLQAKTARSQAKLALQTVEGQIAVTRGSLASAMGVPANIPFDVEDLPGSIPFDTVTVDVDRLIGEALARRPDLAAARAQTMSAEASARKAEGDTLPTLTFNASTGTTWFDVNESTLSTARDRREDAFAMGLTVQYPLFTGYQSTYEERRTREEALGAKEREESLSQRIVFQVYSSYHSLATAAEKVKTADDLVESAERSEEVALGRYREGLGTIVDLLTAQSALSDARSQAIGARWEWFTFLSQLAYDTGLLGLHGEAGSPLPSGAAKPD